MIITEQKPIEEILDILKPYNKVGVLGCAGCVGYYQVGGLKQVNELFEKLKEKGIDVVGKGAVARQCSIDTLREKMPEELEDADVVLSTACGVGVQTLASVLETKPVAPALNTLFMGRKDGGMYYEECLACGDCILHTTGGICPITKCPKSDINGPCGGVHNGKCEVDKARDCALILIYNRLKTLGQLDYMRKRMPPKDFSKRTHPRKAQVKDYDL
jgi:hypothetical protein